MNSIQFFITQLAQIVMTPPKLFLNYVKQQFC